MKRRYTHSSSFKMAVIFTVLLGISLCALGYGIYLSTGAEASAASAEVLQAELEQLKSRFRILGWVGIVCAVLVVLIAFFISDYVVHTINVMSTSADEIMQTGDLSRRIDIDTEWDDLSFLSHVLNDMLARIEELMKGVRRVSDNIAHDLRTPLTRLRTRLEDVQAGKIISAEEKQRLIKDADVMLSMFNGLLRIAKIESIKDQKFATACLQQLANAVAEYYEPLAEEKGVAFCVEAHELIIDCDRDLLFQAIANILDNAIKFTPENGAVSLAVYQQGDHAVLSVTDSGPGISDDDKQGVFRRFYRGDKSRNTPGFGLGLSLVAAIVDLHNGQIELKDAEPGLVVEILLPLQKGS